MALRDLLAGNVGIGNQAPAEKLHVEGKVRAKSGFCIDTNCITTWSAHTNIDMVTPSSDVTLRMQPAGGTNYDPVLKMQGTGNGAAHGAFELVYDNSADNVHLSTLKAFASGHTSSIIFHTGTGSSKALTTNERMRIHGNGTPEK